MPLFSGVPFIVETPAERRKTNLQATALAQREMTDLLRLRQEQQQFDVLLPLRRLQYEAQLTGARSSMVQRDIALKTAQWKLDQYNQQLKEAPVLHQWTQSAWSANSLAELQPPPLGSLTGDNARNAIDLYGQIRYTLATRLKQQQDQQRLNYMLERQNMINQMKGAMDDTQRLVYEQGMYNIRKTVDPLMPQADEFERVQAEEKALLERIMAMKPGSVLPPPGQKIEVQTQSDYQMFLRMLENE